MRWNCKRADIDNKVAFAAQSLSQKLHRGLTELLVVDHLNIEIRILLVWRLVSDDHNSSLLGLSECGLERLGIIRYHQDSVDTAADRILNKSRLFRFVGGSRRLHIGFYAQILGRLFGADFESVKPSSTEFRDHSELVVFR